MLKRKKLPPKPRSCQKVRKSIFEYLFDLYWNKLAPKPRSCQKLNNQFSNSFLIEFWLEKNCYQKEDGAKSWKKQFLNTFFSCATISHFEMFVPSIYSSWEQKPEKSILNTFLIKCWIEKSCRQKLRSCQKQKINFWIFFKWILSRRKLSPKPTSCQKLEKDFLNTFLIEFWVEESCHQNQHRAKS